MGCRAGPRSERTGERMWTLCCFTLTFLITAVFGAPLDPETLMARAGTRLALPCPGRSSVGAPLLVSWLCTDCGRGPGQITIAEYSQDGTVSLLVDPGRIQLVRHSFQLVLDPTSISDTGTYVCRINNSPTPDYIKVVVQDVPDAPGKPLVGGFTSTSVNISWAPSINSRRTPVHNYVVQVKEGEDGTWDLLGGIVTPDNRTAFTVSELKPFTAYSFRVLGVNDLGQGAPSNSSYFIKTLRQLPGERPVVVSAHNASAESIELSWLLPASLETMNGEFLGYQLTYRPVTSDQEEWSEADLHGTDVTSFSIQGLEPYTEYEIRLQYRNMLGLGEPTVVKVWTDEGEPNSPERLTSNEIGDTWAHLTWSRPTRPGAKITGYHVYYEIEDTSSSGQKDGRLVDRTDDIISFNLTGLAPYTRYRVWVVARARRGEGRRSTPLEVRTDVSEPGTPEISNITCRGGSSVYVHWKRPLRLRGAVDFYLVQYRAEQKRQFEELVIPTTVGRQEETMFLPNLTLNTMYEVRVVAGTNSLYQPRVTYRGLPSESHHVYVQPNCESIQQQRLRGTMWRLSPGLVAGIACGAAALLLATLALVMWKKYFQAAYNHLDEQNKTPSVISTDWENDSPDGGGGPVPVHLFPKHVSRLHADGDIGFSKEYEAIQTQTLLDGYTSDFSQQPENKDKNRYLNIVAYDHTRVPLRPLPGQHRCDYVNANFIDGYDKPRAYIGTQGPLPDTYGTFWRMVWEQDVHIIVMITNLMERGRKKCDMYWPQEGSETHGVIKVTAAGEDVMATYTIRKFKLQHMKAKKPRRAATKTVYQYHYTNWPDHGIPENPLPILSFVRKSAAANRDGAGPIIVHCSAGVGRTGTYIVLDSMMRMIRTRGELNIFGFLKYIRTQRNFLVQTEDQYIFVHDALLEAIESGETDIHRSFLSRYLHNLQTTEQDIYPWYNLDRQFKLITYDQATDYDMTSARHPVNYRKNRSMDVLPVESYRVCLTPRPGVDGSDYINASWLLGHSRLQEFIVTQHPLVGTVSAFWQMVWDHNAQTAVLLSPVDDQEYCIFWPLEREEIACDQFRVRFTSERQQGPFVIRDFTLQSFTDDYEMPMRIIQCSEWPLNCTPIGHVFDLIKLVQRDHLEYQNGPCVVVDRFGGTEAATFCCLTTLMKQLEYESHADVYMYARLYHTRRPGVWRNQDDYLYLYRTVESLVSGAASPLPPAPADATVAAIQNHLPVQQPQPPRSQQQLMHQSQKLLHQSQLSLHSLQPQPQHQPSPQQPQQLKPILKNSNVGLQQYHAQQPTTSAYLARQTSTPLKGAIIDDYVGPNPPALVHANGHVGNGSGHGNGHGSAHGNGRPYRIPPDGRESTVLDIEHYVNT